MKKLISIFFLSPLLCYASGITGSAGNELLYLYLILLGVLGVFFGLNLVIKFVWRKYKNWKFQKQYPELDGLF
jgi:hypothetical protein